MRESTGRSLFRGTDYSARCALSFVRPEWHQNCRFSPEIAGSRREIRVADRRRDSRGQRDLRDLRCFNCPAARPLPSRVRWRFSRRDTAALINQMQKRKKQTAGETSARARSSPRDTRDVRLGYRVSRSLKEHSKSRSARAFTLRL